MKRKIFLFLSLGLTASVALATQFPLIGGPGLVHLQSAKAGPGFGYRSLAAVSSYSNQTFYGLQGTDDAFTDLWSHNSISYSPLPGLAVISQGLAHAEQWNIKNPMPDSFTADKSLGCPGDALLALKYQWGLRDGRWDLGLMPVVTIPMNRAKYQDSPSQSGQLDFGGKLLSDFNVSELTVLVNAGFLTRGEERPQLPLGLGLEYGFGQKFSAFLEASAELRLGAQKDSLTDNQILRGRGADRNEIRLTPGLRFAPASFLGLNLGCDIGLSQAAAPWQLILGFDFPAAAGRAPVAPLWGAVAGIINDNSTRAAIKGVISFPDQNLPAVTSDASGNYRLKLKPGRYKVQVTADGYRTITRELEVKAGQDAGWELGLNKKLGQLTLTVTDASGKRPLQAWLNFGAAGQQSYRTDPTTGQYLARLVPGNYTLTVGAPGYISQNVALTVKDKDHLQQNVSLQPLVQAAVPPQPAAPSVAPIPIKPKPVAAKPPAAARPARPATPAAPRMSAEEVTALYKKGVQQFMNEEYSAAEKTFKQVLEADPGHAKAKEYLGKTRDRLKKSKG
ncbi:carboxypeptidase regulatory-like domain-containing protein [candidate division TA06 bacterium]|uniref:Carboxypeptidase regulatory-like domain-containing protein n=1 Tax=candidate division TA06 bacterium TaxID=2250710 RepID=A0A933I9X5_UNCT6|nr:carboxypeptidase regulatory-like domain-containing protein [candidate division TA06 bacterium]